MPDLGGDISNKDEDENSIRDGYDEIHLKRGTKTSYSVEDRIAVTPAVLSEIVLPRA